MSTTMIANGHAKSHKKPTAEVTAPAPVSVAPAPTPITGSRAQVIRIDHDATIAASNAAQIVAGNDMQVNDSSAMLIAAKRDLRVEDAGASVMAAGRDLALMNGGAALMAAGNSLTATNAGAAILWAGHDLTVHSGGGSLQAANQTAINFDQKTILVTGRTVKAERSTVALAIGYDVYVADGSQAVVAVTLRSFVDALVGMACFVPVQVARRVKMRLGE